MAITENGQVVFGAQPLTETGQIVFGSLLTESGDLVFGLTMPTPLGWRSRIGSWVGGLSTPGAVTGFTLSADAGVYTINGDAATITVFNGAYTLSAAAGVYTINGQTVTFGGTGVGHEYEYFARRRKRR